MTARRRHRRHRLAAGVTAGLGAAAGAVFALVAATAPVEQHRVNTGNGPPVSGTRTGPVTVTLTPPSGTVPHLGSTPSTTVLRSTQITYWGPIRSTYTGANTGLLLTPPPPGVTPAIPWQQAAEPCSLTTGTNNCAAPTAPEDVYLAVGRDPYSAVIGPENTLIYVIEETGVCYSAGNAPPGLPDPNSTTTAPHAEPCTSLTFVNATTGHAMGGMSSPGLKPIPPQ
jgi:hypothetical protein